MKKLIIRTMALLFALTFIPAMAVYANAISVTVNGERITIEGQQPVIVDGSTLVPVRAAFEAMGFDVDWNQAYRQAVLSRGNDLLVITIDSATFFVGAESRTLDVPAQMIGGSIMVPLRAILESVGYALDWDGATSTVIITSGAPTATTTTPAHPINQADPLFILRADTGFGWMAYELDEWIEILGVTLDEILDHVRTQSSLDYGFERDFEGIDVSEWASQIESFPGEFMSTVHHAYTATRQVAVVKGWATEHGMTIVEFVEYASAGNDLQPIADALGVEWGEFSTVFAGVANLIMNASADVVNIIMNRSE